jgi:RNA polymerase primary sigma factor
VSSTIKNYISIIESTKNLSFPQEKKLIVKAKNQNVVAKSHLFSAYLKMVFKIAKYYKIKNIFLEDLIEEGILGLEDALERFNIERGNRFSTMARWWVRARILKYIRKNIRIFEVPTATSDKILAINKSIERLDKKLHMPPSNKEIADDLGMKEIKVEFLRKYLIPSVSMNQKINNGDKTIQDLFTDDRNNSREALLRIDNIEKIKEALVKLEQRERSIIEYRYGLKGKEMTLKQVGKKLQLTPERIRQIQNGAEAKLKSLINV